MPQKAGQAEISQPEPSPESAPASERWFWTLSFPSCATHFKHLCREDQFTSKKQKRAAFNTWGFCMALQLSALLQHRKQGKASLRNAAELIHEEVRAPSQPGNCSVLEEPEEQGQCPLAKPGKKGWCWEDLDSSGSRQSQAMAIFQQRPLQPVVLPWKREMDRQNLGCVHGSLQCAPRNRSCATWAFWNNNNYIYIKNIYIIIY